MRFAGVHIKSGTAIVACVETDASGGIGQAVPGLFERFELSAAQDGPAAQVYDLKNRFTQTFRDWHTQGVSLLGTTKYGNWSYAAASVRLHTETAMMIAAVEAGAEFDLAKQAAVTKLLPASSFSALDPQTFGFSAAPKYWTTGGAEAYAVAAYLGHIVDGGN